MPPVAEPRTEQRAEPVREGLDLASFLPYRLSVLATRVSRALASHYRERFGLGIPEWRVMAVLGRDRRLSASEIVERTSMDKVKVSRAIAALERKGLLVRNADAEDRRVRRVELTARGRHIHDRIAALALAWQEEWLAGLDPGDREALLGLLDRLSAALDGPDSATLADR